MDFLFSSAAIYPASITTKGGLFCISFCIIEFRKNQVCIKICISTS